MKNRRNLYVALIAVVLLIEAATVGYVMDMRATSNAIRRSEAVLLSSVVEQSAYLTALFEGQYRSLAYAADVLDENGTDGAELADYLKVFRHESGFSHICVTSEDGETFPDGIDVSDREYYLDALANGRSMASITSRGTGSDVLAMAVAIPGEGGKWTTLCGYYNADGLRALISPHIHDGINKSMLIDSNGDIVLNTDNIDKLDEYKNLDMLRDVSFGDGFSYDRLLESMRNREQGTFTFTYNEKMRAAAYLPFDFNGMFDAGWYVVSVISADVLAAEIENDKGNAYEQNMIMIAFMLAALILLLMFQHERHDKLRHENENARLREERFRIVAEQSGRNCYQYDIATGTCYIETVDRAKFNVSNVINDLVERSINTGRVAEESISAFREFFRRIHSGESPLTDDFRLLESDGTLRWYRFTSTTLFSDSGVPTTAIVSYYDCTELRQSELAYAKWRQELCAMPRDVITVHEWNLTRDEREDGGSWTGIFAEELKDKGFDECRETYCKRKVCEEDRPAYMAFMNRARLIGQFHSGVFTEQIEYRELSGDGDRRWARLTVQLVPYPGANGIKAYLQLQDIDSQKRAELELKARSETDAMTGILNRETFKERVNALIADSPDKTHVIIMLDVDDFKQINDVFGHDAGDRLLIDIVRNTRSLLRTDDLFGRIGGDEFMICLPDVPFDTAVARKAEKICQMLYRKLDSRHNISTSIGISVYPRDGDSFDTLYKKADIALYAAKNVKNGYAFYTPELRDASLDAMSAPAYVAVTPPDEERKLPGLIAASDSTAFMDSLTAMLGETYKILYVSDYHGALAAFNRPRHSLCAMVLDMDASFADDLLATRFRGGFRWAVPMLAVTSKLDEQNALELIRRGVVSVLPKPLNEGLLKVRLELLRALGESMNSQIQTGYSRLQSSSERRFRKVLDATGTIMIVYDTETRAYTADLLSSDFRDVMLDGRRLSEMALSDGIADAENVERMWRLVRSMDDLQKENDETTVKLSVPGGGRHWFRMQVIRLGDESELTPKLLITFNDIDVQMCATEKLRQRAERDSLTGLYNRDTFFEKAAELARSRERGYYVLACMDIDNFKVINDQYGIEEGDRLLQHAASVISAGMESVGGVCCRVSADNFAVMYPREHDSAEFIEKLRVDAGMLDGLPYSNVVFSIGCYVVSDLTLPPSAVYERALMAKATVKGRYDEHVAYYDEQLRQSVLNEQEIIVEMEAALYAGEFVPMLQPQYDRASGALTGAEALVRWVCPGRETLYPDAFIHIFERNGFIYTLDKYMWEQVCALLHKWRLAGRDPLPLSVNVSRYDVYQPDFYDVITSLVEKYELPVSLLRLEIAESAFSESFGQITEMVSRLREYGFIIEIDDFGGGYSSLDTLKSVNADALKVDMRFFESGGDEQRVRVIIESVVSMANKLGIPVIAESVETLRQADYLLSVGCTRMQGFLYARPMYAGKYERLCEASKTERNMPSHLNIETHNF